MSGTRGRDHHDWLTLWLLGFAFYLVFSVIMPNNGFVIMVSRVYIIAFCSDSLFFTFSYPAPNFCWCRSSPNNYIYGFCRWLFSAFQRQCQRKFCTSRTHSLTRLPWRMRTRPRPSNGFLDQFSSFLCEDTVFSSISCSSGSKAVDTLTGGWLTWVQLVCVRLLRGDRRSHTLPTW